MPIFVNLQHSCEGVPVDQVESRDDTTPAVASQLRGRTADVRG